MEECKYLVLCLCFIQINYVLDVKYLLFVFKFLMFSCQLMTLFLCHESGIRRTYICFLHTSSQCTFVIVGLLLTEANIFLSFLIIVCEVSSPLIICIAFLWTLPSSAVSLLRLGNQKHVQHSRWDSTTDLYHSITILSALFTVLCLILQNIMSAFFTTAQHWAEVFNEFSTVIPDYFQKFIQLI